MLNTFLCDELDGNALRLVYAKWRGESVDPTACKQALANLASYGLYLTPDAVFNKEVSPPIFGTANENRDEIDAAFQSLLAPPAGDVVTMSKIGDGQFLKLILPIVLKLLAGFLI